MFISANDRFIAASQDCIHLCNTFHLLWKAYIIPQAKSISCVLENSLKLWDSEFWLKHFPHFTFLFILVPDFSSFNLLLSLRNKTIFFSYLLTSITILEESFVAWLRWVWWLISCFNLTGLQDAQIVVKHYFWVFLWECFWKILASVEWVKQMASPERVGIIQPLEGMNRTKRQRKIEFCLSAWLHEGRHWLSLTLWLGLIPLSLLILGPSDLGWN